ncbi:hypothetical protein DENIS_3497 [Desulfonema ishimotonii]|uniref:Uncharacterized protein n=1 Tax=Desulfonema ishimotonii TaxID=45657 RepID=A0A401FZX4_9BACT|nr:hypothetical protein DENIS_3497 [Desulfonema ishimotonii]
MGLCEKCGGPIFDDRCMVCGDVSDMMIERIVKEAVAELPDERPQPAIIINYGVIFQQEGA